MRKSGVKLTARQLDMALWTRGAASRNEGPSPASGANDELLTDESFGFDLRRQGLFGLVWPTNLSDSICGDEAYTTSFGDPAANLGYGSARPQPQSRAQSRRSTNPCREIHPEARWLQRPLFLGASILASAYWVATAIDRGSAEVAGLNQALKTAAAAPAPAARPSAPGRPDPGKVYDIKIGRWSDPRLQVREDHHRRMGRLPVSVLRSRQPDARKGHQGIRRQGPLQFQAPSALDALQSPSGSPGRRGRASAGLNSGRCTIGSSRARRT